ncbi:hypothetical protein [Pantoea agglomerans]
MAHSEIFHGTRQRFDCFDVTFKGTGEAGNIDACWFTDSFIGAKNHALFKNRNPGVPLVYRCELSSKSIILDHREPLIKQPEIFERLKRYLPLGVSTSLDGRLGYESFKEPFYEPYKGKMLCNRHRRFEDDEVIQLYKSCGIHGIHDWEGIYTDTYLHGTTTVLFDFTELKMLEIIEV